MQANLAHRSLTPLAPLIGEWDVALTDSPYWSGVIHAVVSIQPIEGGAFLVWRSDYETPGTPSSISLIGSDEAVDIFTVLYWDTRGVNRVLKTSLENGVWKTWRNAPGFDQRFTGELSPDGARIPIQMEKSHDNSTWSTDFIRTYT